MTRSANDLSGESISTPRLLASMALLAAMYGVLMLVAFPPAGIWIVAPLVVTPLIGAAMLLRDARGVRWWLASAVFWLTVLVPWLWTARWVREVSDAGWPGMGALMATWPTLFVVLLARVRRGGGRVDGTGAALTAALVWTGVECFRAHIFLHGYPWYLIAHPLIDAPWVAQIAEYGGVAPLSFLTAWTGAQVAESVSMLMAARTLAASPVHGGPSLRRRALKPFILLAALWCAVALVGAMALVTLERAPGPVILAVQTNITPSNKVAWTLEQQVADFKRFRSLTIDGLVEGQRRGQRPLIAAWPETMLPGFGLERDTISLQKALRAPPGDLFSSAIDELVTATRTPMLLGSNAFEGLRDEGPRWTWHRRFNSAYLVLGEPPFARYDKMHLTPFGETMPYVRAWKRLEQALLDIGARGLTLDLDAGVEPVVFVLPDGSRMVTPICFEDTISTLCRALVDGPEGKRADLIVNISNEGWFGSADDSRAAHELAARWRTIELRVPMVRVANTGYSSVIDPTGRVIDRLPAQQDGWLIAPTQLASRRTLFARFGEVGSWVAMIATLLLVGRSFLRRTSPGSATAPGGPGAIAVLTLLIAALTPVACSGPAPKRSTTPPPASPGATGGARPAAADLGLEAPAEQQAWSTRSASVDTEQERASPGESPARPVGPGIPVVHSGDLHRSAVELLQTAARSPYPILVANAIEELTSDPAALRPVVGRALVNPNRGVRFVGAMAVGRARLEDMATLVQPLLIDQSESVRAAAIFALTKLGQPVDQTPLAEMARSDDPEIRGNAVMILGDLGNPSAIPLLRASIGLGMTRADPSRRKITDLQIAEALAKLGEDSELEPIRAALFSPSQQAEMIALACQIVGRVRDGGSISTLQAVAYTTGVAVRPPEIRLLAFIALAELGAGDPNICTDFAKGYLTAPNPQLRGLAVRAAAACGQGAALSQIESRLYDSNPEVQVAAAGAILRLAANGQIPRRR